MSEILLINSVIRAFAPPNNPPLGLLYIAAVLEEAGHEVAICDLNALRWLHSDREYWLRKYMRHYDYIGLSGLIVTYQEQRRVLDFICQNLSGFGHPILISGGGLATSAPEFTFANMPALDLLVLGEGEMTMLDIANGDLFADGTAYQDGRAVCHNDPRPLIHDLDSLPFPAWHLIDMEMEAVYLKNPIWGGDAGNSSRIGYKAKRSANMIVSRGCPYNCNFCASSIMGSAYRMRSVDNVMAEIEALKARYAIDFVGFVDDNTTFNQKWLTQFCEAMIAADMGIKWGGSARVDALDPDILALMKRAGCEFLGFGFESASPEILANMNKKASPEKAATAIRQTREAGITANGTFIAGYPTETKDTLRETARFMKDNDCLNSIFFATPYPGTVLYDEALPKILEKYETEDAYIKSLADATDFRVNLSEMSDMDLCFYCTLAMQGDEF